MRFTTVQKYIDRINIIKNKQKQSSFKLKFFHNYKT